MFKERANGFNWKYGSTLTAKDLARLWKKQRGKCALTGWKLDGTKAHLDHRIPSSLGGTTTIENLRWLHATVNCAKWNRSDEEFINLCSVVIQNAQRSTAASSQL